MKNIRTRLAALEARLGNNEAARRQRRIEALSDEELEAELAVYEAAEAHLSDEEVRANWKEAGFSDDDIDLVIATRIRRREEGGQA
ncbi:MAG: hypothetical protein KGJ57_05010 [Sphingomonadales bacterium]|nr:hypothetical protein [Sphingomonadales bacterium]MDE2168776.1 hypothetical protein [Sphingomonadales bacterium]